MDIILIQVIFLTSFTVFSIIAFFFFISVFTGAPYVPTPMTKVKTMLRLADIKKGDKVVDLGSGDGRLVVEAAKLGAFAHGVEINPGLVFYSLVNIAKNGVSDNAKVSWKSLYKMDFSKYNVIFVAGFIEMMKKLEKEFEVRLKKGTKVICYAFPLPNKQPKFQKDGIYFYQY